MAREGDGNPRGDWWQNRPGTAPGTAPGMMAGFKPLITSQRAIGATSVGLPADDTLRPLIDLVGDDELASMMTITFDVIPPPADTFTGGDVRRLRARIQWGTGGAQHEADVDVRKGTMVTVPASFLRVAVANEGTQLASVRVRASVGYFPKGNGLSPTRTRYIGAISGGSTADHVIPAFARNVTLLRTLGTSGYLLTFLDTNSVVIGTVIVAGSADQFRIPVPNDAHTTRIGASADITLARAIYELDL